MIYYFCVSNHLSSLSKLKSTAWHSYLVWNLLEFKINDSHWLCIDMQWHIEHSVIPKLPVWRTNFENAEMVLFAGLRGAISFFSVSRETRDRTRDFIHGEIFIDSRPRLSRRMHRPCTAAAFQEIHYLSCESLAPLLFRRPNERSVHRGAPPLKLYRRGGAFRPSISSLREI